jgi:hypothetical protein
MSKQPQGVSVFCLLKNKKSSALLPQALPLTDWKEMA